MVMQAIVTCGKTCGCALRTLRTRGHSRHSLHFEHRERAIKPGGGAVRSAPSANTAGHGLSSTR